MRVSFAPLFYFSGRPFPSVISIFARIAYNARGVYFARSKSLAYSTPNVGRVSERKHGHGISTRYPLAHGLRVSSVRCGVFGRRPSSPIKNKLDPLVYRRVCAGMAHIFHFFPQSAARPSPVTPVRKKM